VELDPQVLLRSIVCRQAPGRELVEEIEIESGPTCR